MTRGADDSSLDQHPYVLELRVPQVRFPKGIEAEHQHIWFKGRPDRMITGFDDAGAPYSVAFCVNCPGVRVERVGDAGDRHPDEPLWLPTSGEVAEVTPENAAAIDAAETGK